MIEQTCEIFTPKQAAEYLQVNREVIYRYIRDGKLVASKLGRIYQIPKSSLDMLLWATQARKDVNLREYTGDQIDGFFTSDRLDDEAQAVVNGFLPSSSHH